MPKKSIPCHYFRGIFSISHDCRCTKTTNTTAKPHTVTARKYDKL
ncbi:hypothetical protein NEIPOLOT_00089 [Neisseria polysaccharea ATCC 43768]|nr:hypothetical protein NEIPOLOT_00089 [Neisseria polysaccharea ATCC 43768]